MKLNRCAEESELREAKDPPCADGMRTDRTGLRRAIARCGPGLSNLSRLLVSRHALPENLVHLTLGGEDWRRRVFHTKPIAVGTVIADRPPHRSVRAALPHTALTLDDDDHPARRRRAAARTPSSPRDLEPRRCVRSSSHCSTFSLVSPLPSTDSADSGPLPLFAGFCGTMELSDSPETYMSDLWPRAFSDRSASMEEADVTGVSRLP